MAIRKAGGHARCGGGAADVTETAPRGSRMRAWDYPPARAVPAGCIGSFVIVRSGPDEGESGGYTEFSRNARDAAEPLSKGTPTGHQMEWLWWRAVAPPSAVPHGDHSERPVL